VASVSPSAYPYQEDRLAWGSLQVSNVTHDRVLAIDQGRKEYLTSAIVWKKSEKWARLDSQDELCSSTLRMGTQQAGCPKTESASVMSLYSW
jgi:hypothetical protein